MWYYYILVFFIIMTLYSFYRYDLNYAMNSFFRSQKGGMISNLKNYYGYHMI